MIIVYEHQPAQNRVLVHAFEDGRRAGATITRQRTPREP